MCHSSLTQQLHHTTVYPSSGVSIDDVRSYCGSSDDSPRSILKIRNMKLKNKESQATKAKPTSNLHTTLFLF